MEEGYYWVKPKNFNGGVFIGFRNFEGVWNVLGQFFDDEDLVIGQRVKGQEECDESEGSLS